MSDDLISRQAAIDALGEEPEVWSGKDEYEQGLNNQWHYDVIALKAVPSAQPERKKGKWLAIGNTGLAACECGFITDRCGMYNFCPNCGAKMDEEEPEITEEDWHRDEWRDDVEETD